MILKRLNLGILTMLLLTSCGGKKADNDQSKGAPSYPVMKIQMTEAQLENVYPTTIKGTSDIEIKPRVGGFIDNLYIDEGSVVKKGQLLFTINSPQSEQAVQTARASVNAAQASLNTAQVDVVRYRELAEKNIVSNIQLKTFENAYESSKASLAQAQASLSEALASLSWTKVTSPVDGIAGTIPFRKGSLVTSADVLTTIANTGDVFAYFSINEKQLMALLSKTEGNTEAEKIKKLPEVTLLLANGTAYADKGRIETISGLVNVNTGSVDFRAGFPNLRGELRSGASGKIVMPKVLEDVFVIPQRATFSQLDKTLVYKVQGDSVVQAIIDVQPMPGGQDFAVLDGLKEGEQIVSDGVATLSNGMKIKISK